MTRRRMRWLSVICLLLLLAFAALTILAWRHAGLFLSYRTEGDRTPPPEQLSPLQRAALLVRGVSMTRPRISATPAAAGLVHRSEHLASGDGEVEVWWIDHPQPRGLVLLLPGYAEAKSDLLPDARAWHDLGFSSGLLDFRGAGGSSGSELSFGFREAEDVQVAAAAWMRAGRPGGRLLLYGHSMGGAAALRAVADLGVPADGVIAVSVFDSMQHAVRERFRAVGAPSFPSAALLVFWAGRRRGFDGFALNPADYAARYAGPLLLLHGEADLRAPLYQASNILQRAAGPARLEVFPGAGHESLIARDPARWRTAVAAWLPAL